MSVSPNESLRPWLVRALAGVGATRMAQMALALGVSVLLARSLGAAEYGRYSLALALLGIAALPAYAGVAPLLVRETARYELAAETGLARGAWRRAWGFTLWCSVLALLFLLLIGFVLRDSTQTDIWPALLIGAMAVPLLALTRVGAAALQGMQQVVRATLPEMVIRPAVLLLLLLLLLGAGQLLVSTAIAAFVCAAGVALVVCSVMRRREQNRWPVSEPAERYEDRRWRTALLPFTGIAAVGFLNTELFVPLVGLFSSTTEVAWFRTGMSLAIVCAMPLVLVESVLKPQITRLFEAGETDRLKRLVGRAGLGALGLSLPVVVVYALFGEQLITLLYGSDYQPAHWPMLILTAGFALVNAVGPSMQLLYATDYESDALNISVVSLVLILLASALLIPAFGALGAALAFSLAKLLRALVFRFRAHQLLAEHAGSAVLPANDSRQ